MTGQTPVRWAISPTDHRTHSLLPAGDHPPGVWQARCGHRLPGGVVTHDHLLGWRWCVPCLVAHLVPALVFPYKTPAGRWSSPISDPPSPGGQPIPHDPPVTEGVLPDQGQDGAGDAPPSR